MRIIRTAVLPRLGIGFGGRGGEREREKRDMKTEIP
jgi:hypothetical protein